MTTEERNNLICNNVLFVKKLARLKKRFVCKNISLDDLESAGLFGLVDAASRYDEEKGIFRSFAANRIIGEMNGYVRELRLGRRDKPLKQQKLETEYLLIYDKHDSLDSFEKLIKPLSESGKQIMRWYFLNHLTLKKIGSKIGVNESRVSQLFSSHIERLKKFWINYKNELCEA